MDEEKKTLEEIQALLKELDGDPMGKAVRMMVEGELIADPMARLIRISILIGIPKERILRTINRAWDVMLASDKAEKVTAEAIKKAQE